jgi:hypothetical protein
MPSAIFKLRGLRAGGLAALACAAALAVPACASDTPAPSSTAATTQNETFEKNEIVQAVATFFGVTAEAAGAAVEKIFSEYGRPSAYIKGEEASGAIGVGLRYGKGTLHMKGGTSETVYWQGPSVGWDVGGNGAKCFTLVYNLPSPDYIYRRFPGVEGSAYFIGGIGVNYQRDEKVTLAPMRAGVGFRLGANVGYLSYTRKRHILPF